MADIDDFIEEIKYLEEQLVKEKLKNSQLEVRLEEAEEDLEWAEKTYNEYKRMEVLLREHISLLNDKIKSLEEKLNSLMAGGHC